MVTKGLAGKSKAQQSNGLNSGSTKIGMTPQSNASSCASLGVSVRVHLECANINLSSANKKA